MIDTPAAPEFIVRYPAGHEHEAEVVGRKAVCSRCNAEFKQYRVNSDWLALLREGARAAYLSSCEVDPGGAVYQPARCPKCTRAQLNPEPYAPIL
jgi:predicted Zn-ribbon and HTH transcriptional regulator